MPVSAYGFLGRKTGPGSVAAEKDTLHAEGSYPGGDLLFLGLPIAQASYPGDVEINMRHTRVVMRNGIDEDLKGRIGFRIVIATAAGEMGNLNQAVRSRRDDLVEEYLRFVMTVCAVMADICVHVDDDGHSPFVGEMEDPAKPGDMLGVVEVDVRISEVELERVLEVRVPGATLDFSKGVAA